MTKGSALTRWWIGALVSISVRSSSSPAATARPTLVATDRHSRRRRMRPQSTAGSRSCAVTPRRRGHHVHGEPRWERRGAAVLRGAIGGSPRAPSGPRSRSTAATTGCPRTSWIPKPGAIVRTLPQPEREAGDILWRSMVSRRRADRLRGYGVGDPRLSGIYSIRVSGGGGLERITTNPGRHPRRLLARRHATRVLPIDR